MLCPGVNPDLEMSWHSAHPGYDVYQALNFAYRWTAGLQGIEGHLFSFPGANAR